MEEDNEADAAAFVADQGLSTNVHGRVYHQGRAYSHAMKVEVGRVIVHNMDNLGNINVSKVAREAKMSPKFVRKVHKEMIDHGRILTPEELNATKHCSRGAGSIALSNTDMFVLLQMYQHDPSTSLKSYAQGLMCVTGTQVHPTTIARWFLTAFEFAGTLCKPNLVPFDKFRPDNFEKALAYLAIISCINPVKIKFGDEKHLEGKELYCRRVRRNVLTGEVPAILTHPDFREVHYCGVLWC